MSYESLTKKYRPKTLDDVYGQDGVVLMLKNAVKLNRIGHVYLLIGPAGTGKTSIARIWSKLLNCPNKNPPCCECPTCKAIAEGKSQDVLELNAADKRKIDDMRDVLSKIRFKPMSKYKIVILDECFHKNSLVTMSDFSKKKICDIKVGDTIINSNGVDTVEKVIVNKVPLERLVLLKLNNGTEILTTVDHKFYTDNGWVECHKLKGGDLLYDYEKMCDMWKTVSDKEQKTDDLFKNMWQYSEEENNGDEPYHSKTTQSKNDVSNMQKDISCISLFKKKQTTNLLFIRMCKNWKNWLQNIRRNKKENSRISQTMESDRTRSNALEVEFNSYETKQSNDVSREYRQSNANKNKEWKSWLARSQRWEWRIHRPTVETMCCFNSCNKDRSSFGICNRFRKIKRWLSNKLQSRPCLSKSKTCNRGRWGISQFRMGQSERFKETKYAKPIRVESLTFYKQGDRREYFERYISDKERTCGYIEMYDLTIKKNHNYMVNDVLVHNCHMLSTEAFNALLKDLEEPPEYCIFILCTTNPEKIPDTILSRCQTFELKPIQESDVVERLAYICDEEGFTYETEALELIAKETHGGMRDAVSALEQVACFSNDNIDINMVSDLLGVINTNTFESLLNALYSHDIDECVQIVQSIEESGKSLDKLFYQLQDKYGSMLKNYFKKNVDNKYSKRELLSICKLFIEYENKLKYSSDKFYVIINLLDDMCNQITTDINARLEALEEAIKSGTFKNKPKGIDIERANRINRALYTKDKEKLKSELKQTNSEKIQEQTNLDTTQDDEEIVDALDFLRS